MRLISRTWHQVSTVNSVKNIILIGKSIKASLPKLSPHKPWRWDKIAFINLFPVFRAIWFCLRRSAWRDQEIKSKKRYLIIGPRIPYWFPLCLLIYLSLTPRLLLPFTSLQRFNFSILSIYYNYLSQHPLVQVTLSTMSEVDVIIVSLHPFTRVSIEPILFCITDTYFPSFPSYYIVVTSDIHFPWMVFNTNKAPL